VAPFAYTVPDVCSTGKVIVKVLTLPLVGKSLYTSSLVSQSFVLNRMTVRCLDLLSESSLTLI
jgi:hypothetical protein